MRDRFLFALLASTGMRIGWALGLRHEVVAWERRIEIRARGHAPPGPQQGRQGNLRLVEVLERDEQSLARILDGHDQIEADHADAGGVELDLRDLLHGEGEGG